MTTLAPSPSQPTTLNISDDFLIPSRPDSYISVPIVQKTYSARNIPDQAVPHPAIPVVQISSPQSVQIQDTSAGNGDRHRETGTDDGDTEYHGRPSMEEILPLGMDMRDALAKCEDPRLGWSLQFWITVVDPQTTHTFFACPATGQTSWTPPTGVFIVPRQPEGEWWELADTTRGNRSYFYNTLSGATQWTRPGGDAFVIPLGLIQSATLPRRPRATERSVSGTGVSRDDRTLKGTSSSETLKPGSGPTRAKRSSSIATAHSSTPNTPIGRHIPIPLNSPTTPTRSSQARKVTPSKLPETNAGFPLPDLTASIISAISAKSSSPDSIPLTPESDRTMTRRPLSVVGEEGSGNEGDESAFSEDDAESKMRKIAKLYGSVGSKSTQQKESVFSRRRLSSIGLKSVLTKTNRPPTAAPTVPFRGSSLSVHSISAPSPMSMVDLRMSDDKRLSPLSPSSDQTHFKPILAGAKIHIEPASRPIPIATHSTVDLSTPLQTKCMSSGLHPLLPLPVSADIHAFQIDTFAEQYFAKRRQGFMRQRVPISRLMTWQKSPISAPLLEATVKSYSKEAVTAFKVIQRAMGERDKAVDLAKPIRPSASVSELGSAPARTGLGSQNVQHGRQEQVMVLEEIRWMIQIGVFVREMRDEIYAQTVKQLTGNATFFPTVLGFQLLCVLVNAFPPTAQFEPFIRDFLSRHIETNIKGIGIMASYCLHKLDQIRNLGLRAKPLTVGEIEQASDAAFYPCIYGDSLNAIMQRQSADSPAKQSSLLQYSSTKDANLNVPVILPFLARSIIQLGGLKAEGIFRVPGDAEVVAELRSRMDRGHYHLAGMNDPHVAASLFKLFLRELLEPVVPSDRYNEALESSSTPEEAIAFLCTLPTTHKRVLVFVIFFIRIFCGDEVFKATKMTPSNLALVLAPNILRTTSDSLVTVYTNASFESKWILTLLQHLDKRHLHSSDWPEMDFE